MYSRDEIRERLAFAIPFFWQNIREVKNIQDKQADELEKWWKEFFRYQNSRSVLTADSEYLKKWEAALAIPIDTNKPLEERRSLALSKLRGMGTVTKALIKSTAESFEFGAVEVYENDGEIIIQFTSSMGVPPNLPDIQRALRAIIPAHLEIDYLFKFSRYTDYTNRTYGDLASGTYEELLTSAGGGSGTLYLALSRMTHEELEKYMHEDV